MTAKRQWAWANDRSVIQNLRAENAIQIDTMRMENEALKAETAVLKEQLKKAQAYVESLLAVKDAIKEGRG